MSKQSLPSMVGGRPLFCSMFTSPFTPENANTFTAGSTCTAIRQLADVRVHWRELMAFVAMCFGLICASYAAIGIVVAREESQMERIDASPVSADMVHNHFLWNLPNFPFIDDAMGLSLGSLAVGEQFSNDAIASRFVYWPLPEPALVGNVDFIRQVFVQSHEQRFWWSSNSFHKKWLAPRERYGLLEKQSLPKCERNQWLIWNGHNEAMARA